MIRKLALAAALALGTVGSLTISPATASAQPPAGFDRDHGHDHMHGHFRVLVRHRLHWDVHGTYRDRDDAVRVARRLERQGYDTRVERVR